MSKIGLILECGPEGPDEKVLRYWLKEHAPDVTAVDVTPLSNKRDLLDGCGKAAADLLADGCERVIVVWDLYPAWQDTEPCRKEDRDTALRSLEAARVPQAQVALVAIESMLECWFLADERAISQYAPSRRGVDQIQ